MLRSRIGWCFLLVVFLALGGSAAAQESPPKATEKPQEDAGTEARRPPQPGDETKVFILQHATPRVLADVLQVFPATITYSRFGPQPQSALAVSAPPAVMAAIEETIKRLDKPPAPARGVELTGYIVEALADAPTMDVPPSLEPVVAQLRETFTYQGYRVIDTVVARSSGDTATHVQGVTSPSPDRLIAYELSVSRIEVATTDEGSRILLRQLAFSAIPVRRSPGGFLSPPPGQGSGARAEFRASIELREGQQAIVGKAGLGDSGNALLLVLSARIVD
jgi:hypothetical protein